MTSPEALTPTRKKASAPFDMSTADVVFVTSDNVEFHVFKAVLILASPFFSDMFTLGTPANASSEKAEPIPISEDSQTFDRLLRLCYPIDDPVVSCLPDMEKTLAAAIKYQMAQATKIVRQWLTNQALTYPLHVYAIACRHNLESEAGTAATQWKTKKAYKSIFSFSTPAVPSSDYIHEMNDISAGAYFRLLRYLRDRSQGGSIPTFIRPSILRPPSPRYFSTQTGRSPVDASDTDIILRSVDGVSFNANTLLLRMVSAEKLIALAVPQDNVRVAQLDLDSQTLSDLLSLFHPLPTTPIEDPLRIMHILRAAMKYTTPITTDMIRRRFMHSPPSDPLAMYFIAAEFGSLAEEEAAARAFSTQCTEDTYTPLLEEVNAGAYHSLLQFHRECSSAIAAVVKQYAPSGNVVSPNTSSSSSSAESTQLSWTVVAVEELRNSYLSHPTSTCRWCKTSGLRFDDDHVAEHVKSCPGISQFLRERDKAFRDAVQRRVATVKYVSPATTES